ncbi:MAG: hypothetical protein FJ390_02665 [Verrucomicrobia bacterium]|nr:hypothetical protein [Verrucomicrobiota bacterium]
MTQTRFFIFFTVAIAALLFSFADVHAQQSRQPDTEFVAPKKLKRTPPKKAEQESLIKLNGSLTQAVKSKQPWQVVNPLAPASYGTGEKNVSEDPDEVGRPQGLLLFGIEW